MTAGNKQLTSYVTIFTQHLGLLLIYTIDVLWRLVVIDMAGDAKQYH